MGKLIGVSFWHFNVDRNMQWENIKLVENFTQGLDGYMTNVLKMVSGSLYLELQYKCEPLVTCNIKVVISYMTWSGFEFWRKESTLSTSGYSSWVRLGDSLLTTTEYSDFYICIQTYEYNNMTGLVYVPVTVYTGSVTGRLYVNSNPQGAYIYLNTQKTSYKTPDTLELLPGSYSVTVELEGYKKPSYKPVTITAGSTTSVSFELEKLYYTPPTGKYYGELKATIIPMSPFASDNDYIKDFTDRVNKILAENEAQLGAKMWIQNVKLNKTSPLLYEIVGDLYYASPVPIPAAVLAVIALIKVLSPIIIIGFIAYIVTSITSVVKGDEAAKELANKGISLSDKIIKNSDDVLKELDEIKASYDNLYVTGRISEEEYNQFIERYKKVKSLVTESKQAAEEYKQDASEWLNNYQKMSMDLVGTLISTLIPIMIIFMFFSMMVSMVRGD